MTSGLALISNELCSYIYVVSRYLADGVRILYLDFKLMGKGMAYGGLPFLDTGCPVPDAYIYYVPNMINVWDTFFYIHPPPLDVYTHGQSFEQWIG